MIERLARALEHIDKVPEPVQEQLAEQIEVFASTSQVAAASRAGAWSDLPDDMEETLLRWRRESWSESRL
jgi:hypothetical protein